jgi:hypothetical protein
MNNLKAQLGEAQRKGEHEKVDELMSKLDKLSKLKNELQTS